MIGARKSRQWNMSFILYMAGIASQAKHESGHTLGLCSHIALHFNIWAIWKEDTMPVVKPIMDDEKKR